MCAHTDQPSCFDPAWRGVLRTRRHGPKRLSFPVGHELLVPGYPTRAPRDFPSAARLSSSRGSGLSSVAARCASTTRNNSNWIRLSSLRNKRPDLSGRPPCKGVAIGAARRTARLGGESTLRVPPCCSFPVSSQPLRRTARRIVRRWASFVRARRACACWCGKTRRGRRARELAWQGVPQKRRRRKKKCRPKKDKGQRSKTRTRRKVARVPQGWGVLWR